MITGRSKRALSQAHRAGYVNGLKRRNAARFERLHGQVDLSCRNLSNAMVISSIQIFTYTAFSLVPTKILILSCRFKRLNGSSIYHRSL